jgi:hypothetical protein
MALLPNFPDSYSLSRFRFASQSLIPRGTPGHIHVTEIAKPTTSGDRQVESTSSDTSPYQPISYCLSYAQVLLLK